MLIEKANGELEEFKVQKLRRSLQKAGASHKEIQRITTTIEDELHEGMKTAAIYRRAFSLLRQSEQPLAARYSLRRALFNLGPTGFPFEDFLARLFEAEGYNTVTRLTVHGTCATHEIDVAAYKKDHCFLVEAKFHSRPGIKSDMQVLLYSYARFLDLKGKKTHVQDRCGVKGSLIATNTKFTRSAIDYAECVGLDLLSWNYPKERSLQERVETLRLFPITVLTTLTASQKRVLLERGIVLCRDLVDNRNILRSAGVPQKKIELVLRESKELCTA